jgi:hypothetical protein
LRSVSDERIVNRFWSRVDKGSTTDGCWEWQGGFKPGGYPSFQIGQSSIAAAYVAWFSTTGELPLGGRIQQLCENHRCVRPSHLAWIVGRMMERRVADQHDGYVSISGVPMPMANRPPRTPRMLRLIEARDIATVESRDERKWAPDIDEAVPA